MREGGCGRSMLVGLEAWLRAGTIQPHDMLVKLTGRYRLDGAWLMSWAEANPHADALIHWLPHEKQVFTGAFGMRAGLLVTLLRGMDWEFLESRWVNLERALRDRLVEECAGPAWPREMGSHWPALPLCHVVHMPRLGVVAYDQELPPVRL